MHNPPCIHILIVEDNVINQTLFAKMLSVLGFNADIAENGVRALEAHLLQPYDIIFMDYQMPGIDGLETAKHIKSVNREIKPVIILMTSNVLVNDEYLTRDGVLDDFLNKPFTLQGIAAMIEKWQPAFVGQHHLKNE